MAPTLGVSRLSNLGRGSLEILGAPKLIKSRRSEVYIYPMYRRGSLLARLWGWGASMSLNALSLRTVRARAQAPQLLTVRNVVVSVQGLDTVMCSKRSFQRPVRGFRMWDQFKIEAWDKSRHSQGPGRRLFGTAPLCSLNDNNDNGYRWVSASRNAEAGLCVRPAAAAAPGETAEMFMQTPWMTLDAKMTRAHQGFLGCC